MRFVSGKGVARGRVARQGMIAGSCALLMLGVSGNAMAQSTSAADDEESSDASRELVVTAPNYVPTATVGSKVPTSLLETPQSITVITRDQIELLDWTNLQQVVRYSAGVNGELYGDDTRTDWIRLRGTDPVIYVDGVQSGGFAVDLYGYESVDILKGPSSTLYGLAPPGGIINMTSRRPRDEMEGEFGVRYGSFDVYEAKATIAGPASDDVSGRFTALFRDNGVPHARGEHDQRIFVSAAVTIGSGRTSFTPMAMYQYDKLENNGGGFLPYIGTAVASNFGKIRRGFNFGEPGYNFYRRDQAALGYEVRHEFSDKVTFEQNLKYNWTDIDNRYVYGIFYADTVTPSTRVVRRNNYALPQRIRQFAVDNRLMMNFDTGGLDHTLIGGVDYRARDYKDWYAFGEAPAIDLYDPVYGATPVPQLTPLSYSDNIEKQLGFYVQDQIRTGGFVFTLGGRHDTVKRKLRDTVYLDPQNFEVSKFSYRLGVNYVTDFGLAPYATFAKSFLPQNYLRIDGTPVNPKEGEMIEVGLKFQPPGASRRAKTLITAALFRSIDRNEARYDPRSIGVDYRYIEFGKTQTKGFELEIVSRIDERLNINGSYSYTDIRIKKSYDPALEGLTFPDIPRHKASLFLDYTFQDGALAGLGGGFGVRYNSAKFGDEYNSAIYRLPALTLFDAALHYNVGDWRLSVTANNLFDKNYIATCYSPKNCFYGTQRQISASVTRKF